MLKAGKKPDGLDRVGRVAVDATIVLAAKPRSLGKELWNQLVEVLGKRCIGGRAFRCVVCVQLDLVECMRRAATRGEKVWQS